MVSAGQKELLKSSIFLLKNKKTLRREFDLIQKIVDDETQDALLIKKALAQDNVFKKLGLLKEEVSSLENMFSDCVEGPLNQLILEVKFEDLKMALENSLQLSDQKAKQLPDQKNSLSFIKQCSGEMTLPKNKAPQQISHLNTKEMSINEQLSSICISPNTEMNKTPLSKHSQTLLCEESSREEGSKANSNSYLDLSCLNDTKKMKELIEEDEFEDPGQSSPFIRKKILDLNDQRQPFMD